MLRNPYVRNKFALIKDAINRIEKFKGDRKIAVDLESYLVVLLSGIYEDCLEYLINKRVNQAGDVEVSAFVEKTLDIQLRNPNWDNLTKVLGWFSKKWVTTLNKKIRNRAKTDLNNIVTNKNAVAHGNTSNLTLAEIKNCHKYCKSIFEKLEKII
jgi:hypothetical protein